MPAEHLPGGTVVAERAPRAAPSLPAPEAPKGGKRKRTGEIVIAPKPKPVDPPGGVQPPAPEDYYCPRFECPPVKVRVDTYELPDGSSRLAAYSEDGEILSFKDIPVAPALMPRPLPWAVGAFYRPGEKLAGGFIDRDFSRLRAGVSAGYGQESGWSGEIRLGWRLP